MNIVIDASLALSFYLEDERNERATELLESLGNYEIIAPSHWWSGMVNGLLMAERRKRINRNAIIETVQSLVMLDVKIIQITPTEFTEKIIPLAGNYNLTSYDACYLYLAIRERAVLATLDKALLRAARKEKAMVFG